MAQTVEALERDSRFGDLLNYWGAKRGTRAMPARADIQPNEILPLLPNIVLVDVLRDPLDFRYRLIGTAIVERLPRDYTGLRFMQLPHQRPGSRVWQTAVRLVTEKRPVFSDIPYVGPDKQVRAYRDAYLPLSADGDNVDMILGLVLFQS